MGYRYGAIDNSLVGGTAEQIDRGPGQQDCDLCGGRMGMRMCQHEIVADRRGDDTCDENGVDVVEVSADAAGVFRVRNRVGRILARCAEVQPPHGQGAEEGGQQCEHDRDIPFGGAGKRGAAGKQGFAKCHDHEQLAALGEVATFDGPIPRVRAAHARQGKAEHRRYVFA